MMNLVSLIAGQVQTKQELFSNEGKIMDALMSSGYRLQEVDTAITLMQALAQDAAGAAERPQALTGMRAMSTEERGRFALDAFGLVTKLTVLGIITDEQREDVIEKALALHRGKIRLDAVKTLLALNLFGDPGEYEELASAAEDRRGSAWN
jgi:Smg protein